MTWHSRIKQKKMTWLNYLNSLHNALKKWHDMTHNNTGQWLAWQHTTMMTPKYTCCQMTWKYIYIIFFVYSICTNYHQRATWVTEQLLFCSLLSSFMKHAKATSHVGLSLTHSMLCRRWYSDTRTYENSWRARSFNWVHMFINFSLSGWLQQCWF